MIAIIDYGMGNLHSVEKAVGLFSKEFVITNNPADLTAAKKIILPGVGAFCDGIKGLQRHKLFSALSQAIKQNKPFLGICLGMQLLFEYSQESGGCQGLGIMKGIIKRFSLPSGFKVPHIGWNQIKVKGSGCPLLKDIPDNSYVYFCHSYYAQPQSDEVIAATTDYAIDFASCVWKDNTFGVQFHPEKSQKIGLKILENFVRLR
jgi:glutamine amidotransferase